MYTLQDLNELKTDKSRIDFSLKIISAHQSSEEYKTAKIANDYDRQKNTTICTYQRFLYNLKGKAIPDTFKANYKLASNFFNSFVTQQNQYLLGNGVFLTEKQSEKDKLLGKDFDTQLQKAGRTALVEGCSFGFWNLDHLEIFKLTEFAPLYDEENGALGAGVRFWQIDESKPLRFTLYELDGYTDFIRRKNKDAEILHPKRAYKLIKVTTGLDGTEIVDFENYPNFPIVPLWANEFHQSSIVGIREKIDCYDLIQSGFANDLDNATSIYWIIKNAGGMEDSDLTRFLERLKLVGAASLDADAGVDAQAHTIDVPYTARETYLTRLEQDMYKDFGVVNVSTISGGNKTATEIMAAYQPMDTKADQYEYMVLDFLDGIFKLAGIDDYPTFKRNRIVNQLEETNMVIAAAQYLDDEAVLKHLPFLTPDEVDDIMKRKDEEDVERLINTQTNDSANVVNTQNNLPANNNQNTQNASTSEIQQ